MPKVGSDIPDSSHDLSISDGVRTWFFNIDGDPPQLDEQPRTPDTVFVDKRGREFGDWDPDHAHIQQSDWQGGRGQNEFHEDETRFFDSQMLWNFTPGHLHPVPQWRFGEGYSSSDNMLMGATRTAVGTNVHWQPLLSQTRYSRKFTASASYTATVGQLWIRKRGSPQGNLTFAIFNNSAGQPGASQSSATLASTDFSDEISTLAEFTLSQSLTSGTIYHIVVWVTDDGDDRNHFELGYSDGGAAGNYYTSPDGSAWTTESTVQMLVRTTATRMAGFWRFFYLEGALYAVGDRRDGVATLLYINGDRGIATAGASTTLTDGVKSWSTNLWAGARVRITKGTGKGQHRAIASNTGTVLTVSSAWDTNPSTDSEYVIYATDEFTVVTPASATVDKAVKSIAVFSNQALFAYGSVQPLFRLRWDSSDPGHDGRDESGGATADHVAVDYDAVDGAVVWRAENNTVDASRSVVKAWSTDLAFGTEIPCGDQSWSITGLVAHEGKIYVLKEDSIGFISNDRYTKMNIGLDSMAQPTNGIANAVWNLFLYFNWAFSTEQLYSGNLDDIGPWLHAGLPASRRGHASHLLPTNAIIYGAIDAGTDRTSSVLAWNKIGWGEIMRSWKAGLRCQQVAWQACPGTQDRLWMSIGGEIVAMEFPDDALNFLADTDINYHHESVMVTSTVNMNAANIRKLFKELSLTTRNLDNSTSILAEYQIDNEIDGTTWHEIGEFKLSDYQELGINEGNKRRIRLRLRFMTEDSDSPPVLRAWVLEAFARTPVKYQWTMRAISKGLTRDSAGELDVDPSEFIAWLKDMGQDASYLVMRSKWSELDNKAVLVQPPGVFRTFQNRLTKRKGVLMTLAIREA